MTQWWEYGVAVVIIATPIASFISVYVAHRTSTGVDIKNLQKLVDEMDEDIELKVNKEDCESGMNRIEKDISELKTTSKNTSDTVIRLETKMDSLLSRRRPQ